MNKKYDLYFDSNLIARVEINEEKSKMAIQEMVEFWMGWKDKLEENDGDYIQTWLKQLVIYIVRMGSSPSNQEGWYPLDGSHGIKLEKWSRYIPDDRLIEIEEAEGK
jgi:hypothetical protein